MRTIINKQTVKVGQIVACNDSEHSNIGIVTEVNDKTFKVAWNRLIPSHNLSSFEVSKETMNTTEKKASKFLMFSADQDLIEYWEDVNITNQYKTKINQLNTEMMRAMEINNRKKRIETLISLQNEMNELMSELTNNYIKKIQR